MRRALVLVVVLLLAGLCGCRSPRRQVALADETAYGAIADAQRDAIGEATEFTIESPAETLRQRLIEAQALPIGHPASPSPALVQPIDHWPEGFPPASEARPEAAPVLAEEAPLQLSLVEALQVAARNTRGYQAAKEAVFREALSLDLRRYDFSTQLAGDAGATYEGNETEAESGRSVTADASLDATRTLESGALLSGAFTLNFIEILTGTAGSLFGYDADVSVTIPLLRGSGSHIAREPLTQAERNMLYAVYDYERFKREFVVGVADQYLNVLRQLDSVNNAEENYRRLRDSVVRTEALAENERLPRIQVDQARQDELRARSGWILALQDYTSSLDRFKITLGLPADAHIELDPAELQRVLNVDTMPDLDDLEVPSADTGPVLEPWLDEARAVDVALRNRLDLMVAAARIEDAQRQVVIAVDRLRPELTLGGAATWGSTEASSSFDRTLEDLASFNNGRYTGLITLDPGLQRTLERNGLRNELIDYHTAVRSYQEAEDAVKLDVREAIRSLVAARENVVIQKNAVRLAEGRVESTALFLDLERAQVRDLLDAESDLLDARNAYTTAQVGYRVAFLELQRDLGILEVDENGVWTEREYRTMLDE